MNILFITEDLGITAPGLVANKILNEFEKNHNVYVITSDCIEEYFHRENVLIIPKSKNRRVIRESLKWLGLDLTSYVWCIKVRHKVTNHIDLVFSVISMFHYGPLILGHKLKDKLRCKFFVNAVDAIPAPYPYKMQESERKKVATFMRKYTKNVDIIYSTCKEMSDYQRDIGNSDAVYKELFNPSGSTSLINCPRESDTPVFVYAGNIYYPRNVNYVLLAFDQICEDYPSSSIIFAGSSKSYIIDKISELQLKHPNNVTVLDFQKNTQQLYSIAWALIDIGCEVENDIFLSSKITSYLPYTKPIICEASRGTAAARLFANMDSIILCDHSSESIYEAMKIVIKKSSWNFSERSNLLQQMSPEAVANTIYNDYSKLNSNC